MAMPKKQDAKAKVVISGKLGGARPKHIQGSPSPTNQKQTTPLKLAPFNTSQSPSPVSVGSNPRSPPRTPPLSPGLLNMHYAACKFAEPPKPSSLPLPPQHWTQTNRAVMMPFRATPKPLFDYNHDVTHQLKLLLKVQA